MLLDVRTYTCRPGTIKKHLEIYEKFGKAPQTRNLGQPLAYMACETGDPNQYVHIWVYDNAGDREAKRAGMWADPDWVTYTQKSAEFGALVAQENKLMIQVPFYALRHAAAGTKPGNNSTSLMDVRTYTCRPGTIKKHLEIYEKYGKEAQTRNLGQPLAYMACETGDPNQYVHIWTYDNAGDREKKRAAMQADPDWQTYLQKSAEFGGLMAQANKLMKQVPFFEVMS